MWNTIGFDLAALGKYNESLETFNKSIEQSPNWVLPWTNKAKVLHKLGKYNESNAAFAKARELGYTGPSLPTRIVAPQETIRVMTYNIFNGAGVDPTFEKWAADHGYPGNRLSKVLEIIKTADPDILGIQEAAGWDKGDPTIIKQVAEELGMKYFLGRCIYAESGFNHVAVLTKFDIKEAKDYPGDFRNAALRAEVVTPQGRSIQVFVVHFIPPNQPTELKPAHLKNVQSNEIYDREISFLVEKMKPYSNSSIILMGDMNKPHSQIEDVFHEVNLSLAAESEIMHIDSIWVSPALASNVRSMIIPYKLTQGTSDHLPVVAEIDVPS
jgi:endonuclease/exonuclease/phosphatase family metal-dependent hydrolase